MLLWIVASRVTAERGRADSVKDPNTALQSTAEDWVVAYQETPGKALSELVTFFIRVSPFAAATVTPRAHAACQSCGCNSTVDEDVAQDLDAIVDNLEEVQEEFKKVRAAAWLFAR